MSRSTRPPSSLTRRAFLGAAGAGAAVLGAPRSLRAGVATPGKHVAFNTANLVARVTGYRYQLSQWMDQHKKTIAATDEAAWRAICQEIAAKGFKTVEVWEAHAAPESLDEAKARTWKRALDENGLAKNRGRLASRSPARASTVCGPGLGVSFAENV